MRQEITGSTWKNRDKHTVWLSSCEPSYYMLVVRGSSFIGKNVSEQLFYIKIPH